MSKEKLLVDEKFNEDDLPITNQMIKEKNVKPEVPSEIPKSTPYEERDMYYSQILANYNTEYKERRKQIKTMRNILFWSMLSILATVIVCCMVMFFIIVVNASKGIQIDIVAIITVAVSFVSTILTIPIIIAKSLFPEKEDNQIIDVLTKLIENDENIRNKPKQQS